jgi:hypothetical protein
MGDMGDSGVVTAELGTNGPPARRLGIGVLVLLSLLAILLGGLRFARIDLAGTSFFATDEYYTYETEGGRHIEHLNIDIVSYLAMIEDARGVEGAFYKMEPYPQFVAAGDDVPMGPVAPFVHRPVLPYLASLLPMDASFAFAAVNLAVVVLGLWALVDALARQGRSTTAQLVGGLLYVVALPIVVFASALYIDGGAMAMLTIGYWLVVRRWWWAFAVFLPLSYGVKESMIFLAPAAIVAWRASGRSWRDRAFVLGAPLVLAAFIAVAVLVRVLAPTPEYSYSVWPKLSYFGGNLGNITSTAFFIVGSASVALPALVCIVVLVRERGLGGAFELAGTEITGVVTMVGVNLYSMVSTDLTLRTGWLVWPFAISLSALLVDRLRSERGERSGAAPVAAG